MGVVPLPMLPPQPPKQPRSPLPPLPTIVQAQQSLMAQAAANNHAQAQAAAQMAANSLLGPLQGNAMNQRYPQQASPAPPTYHPPDRVVLSVNPQSTIAANKISHTLTQLPMRLAGKISSITFVEKLDHNHKPTAQAFVITYTNNRTLEFDDIDAFPSEADIARIALECP